MRDIHAVGIVHRDIKPSNVFLSGPKLAKAGGDEKITVKLIDFGVARLREMAHVTDALTTPSHVIGSLGYMAPEQFRRARGVTPAADLYAVGVVIYRALTGKLPFNDHSLERVVRMKTEEQSPRVSASGKIPLDSPLDLFVCKALQRDAGERFQSAREMLEAWWQATEAAGIEPPRPPATVEGMDIVFDEEPPIPSEVTEAMLETLSGPAPDDARAAGIDRVSAAMHPARSISRLYEAPRPGGLTSARRGLSARRLPRSGVRGRARLGPASALPARFPDTVPSFVDARIQVISLRAGVEVGAQKDVKTYRPGAPSRPGPRAAPPSSGDLSCRAGSPQNTKLTSAEDTWLRSSASTWERPTASSRSWKGVSPR